MANENKEKVLKALVEALDIPDSAYHAAENRYYDLGHWLGDVSRSKCAQFKPHVSLQGSFRLGTVTKPWNHDEYDLDLSCKLQEGITKLNHSQEYLKELLGEDLKAYREERKIREELERKHRCWRLNYQDQLRFHMDAVPGIPESHTVCRSLQERMIQAGTSQFLARDIAELVVAITDDRKESYSQISDDWLVSNPEGYAKWFESRMKLGETFMRSRIIETRISRIEDLPTYRWKTPLQMAIQILKRHRDIMFERNPDRRPISIIITTVAAQAYGGEFDLLTALDNILAKIVVNHRHPRIPNPVNPSEDFANRWSTPEGGRLRLEENFFVWLEQARNDISTITSSFDRELLKEQLKEKFGAVLNEDLLNRIISSSPRISVTTPIHTIRDAPRPWCQ